MRVSGPFAGTYPTFVLRAADEACVVVALTAHLVILGWLFVGLHAVNDPQIDNALAGLLGVEVILALVSTVAIVFPRPGVKRREALSTRAHSVGVYAAPNAGGIAPPLNWRETPPRWHVPPDRR
jgi:hypothetical protein